MLCPGKISYLLQQNLFAVVIICYKHLIILFLLLLFVFFFFSYRSSNQFSSTIQKSSRPLFLENVLWSKS